MISGGVELMVGYPGPDFGPLIGFGLAIHVQILRTFAFAYADHRPRRGRDGRGIRGYPVEGYRAIRRRTFQQRNLAALPA
jgi:hypothetical protein